MTHALPALLLLALRAASVLFLLLYPLSAFVWRLLTKPWVTTPLKQGVRYVLEPLAHLEARRLYQEQESALSALPLPPEPRLDINKVSFAELCAVEGIGATRAHEIIAYREDYGPFRRMEELALIPGVGPKTFKGLCERFEVPGERARRQRPHERYAELNAQLQGALPRALPRLSAEESSPATQPSALASSLAPSLTLRPPKEPLIIEIEPESEPEPEAENMEMNSSPRVTIKGAL
jgi:competence ComEA-like helix-hairpin-helix protein